MAMETESQRAASASYAVGGGSDRRRDEARRIGRERLLRYIKDIIRIQHTPLRDIIRDHALQYLPAQSLLRLRAVSTAWKHHISSPFFAHSQSRFHRSLSGLFHHTPSPLGPISYLPFDPKAYSLPDASLTFLPEAVQIVASSNGLVVCHAFTSGRVEHKRYYVCNPATTQWTTLPRPVHHWRAGVVLVFQPSALNFSADYHLVCTNFRHFEVFSSKTGKWDTSKAVLPIPDAAAAVAAAAKSSGVAVGGVAYWRTERGGVISYDPLEDKHHVIAPPPSAASGEWSRWEIGEMDGKLCCVGVAESVVEVYAMEARGGAWWKVGAVEVAGDPWPLVVEGREELVVVWVEGRVIGIEVRTGRRRVLGEGVPMSCTQGKPYISSLVSPREFLVSFTERKRFRKYFTEVVSEDRFRERVQSLTGMAGDSQVL